MSPPINICVGVLASLLLMQVFKAESAPLKSTHASSIEVSADRLRASFNANWRFFLGDAAGAEHPEFDDSKWSSVGLPHSFSLPYFQAPAFYVGYGWYRKTLQIDHPLKGRQVFLEFEGAFQDAEVFVNGVKLARHRGGYTGFPVNMTSALHVGANIIAVRVNNKWDPTLAPRAGEHVFSGGIYRDVWLVETSDVHVPWTGTFVTTPDLSAREGKVAVDTEVRNDSSGDAAVTVETEVVDANGAVVARLPSVRVQAAPGATTTAHQLSAPIPRPRLWSPETPNLYRTVTRLIVNGREGDRYQTEFGFRWFSWSADKGFFLNGEHRYFRGANVHQDQAGWGDAVTNAAIDRDVQLIKDAGFDFIRGSHYPHDPHFAEATDRIGLMFLSEAPFWGTAGFNNPWGASAYPTDPNQSAAFDASVKQQLAEMIRINRNHPSIVVWGMDNEVFFTAQETLPQVKRLLAEEVALSHQLDPSRPAAVDGAQRGDIDRIGDIAGYNGDGAVLFPNPHIANFVAEYGSTIADRPGDYGPGWGDIEHTPDAVPGQPDSWRPAWRSGEAIWAGFDHGSIAGRQFGSMGLVDYSRLPKRAWYWYRHAYRGIAPPAWPKQGQAAALRLSSSSPVIRHADGTDDVRLVVTVVDAKGQALSNSPPVSLKIEAGPGELPTGRHIDFAANSDIPIRDGQAAIALRSWQSGVTRLRATSPGLKDAVLEIKSLDGPAFKPGVTPLAADRPYQPLQRAVTGEAVEQTFGGDNPTGASSSAPGHPPRLVNDGDVSTYWLPAKEDAQAWVSVDPERIIAVRRVLITLAAPGRYAIHAEIQTPSGDWRPLVDQPMGEIVGPSLELKTAAVTGEKVRLQVRSATGEPVGVGELRIVGVLETQ
jgi:beta-galactosidase